MTSCSNLCAQSAVHLELRDQYALGSHADAFTAWRSGALSSEERAARWSSFHDTVAAAVGRGVAFRRLRVVSVPVSPYIAFEYAGAPAAIKAGEDVRWVARFDLRDLLLPAHDFWIFDDRWITWAVFDGEGVVRSREVDDDSELAAHLMTGFERAWQRAVPHAEFEV